MTNLPPGWSRLVESQHLAVWI